MNPTHDPFKLHRERGATRLGGALALALAACAPLHALTVTLGANNAFGTSSFNTSLSWSDGAAPAAGNAYVVPAGLALRTPADSAVDHVFAGDSLTLTGATQFIPNVGGVGNWSLPIANNPALLGLQIDMQGFAFDPLMACTGGVASTARATITAYVP